MKGDDMNDLTALARMTGVMDSRTARSSDRARIRARQYAELEALQQARRRAQALNTIALATSVGAILFVAILGGLA